MKKILIICGKLCVGGAEKVAYSIGHYVDRSKYECHYVVFGDSVGEYEAELLKDGSKIFHIPGPGESYTTYWKNLTRLIKEYQYDVVHCHTMFNSGIVLLAARLKGVPCRIAHSHSICSSTKRPLIKQLYENAMRFLIKKCATEYVACGNKAGEWLYGKKLFQKSGILLLNGIDTVQFTYSEEKRNRIRESYNLKDKFVIGHVGHLLEVKNQVFLLNMLPKILAKRPETVLMLIGEGQDRKMLENRIKELNILEHVIMTGNVMNVPDYLSALDVFVFPSLYEGMPLAMLEVQANGLPCVMSDAVPEDVHLTDLLNIMSLTEPVDEWVEAIVTCERKDAEKYAEEMYKKGYDIKMVVEKMYSLYEKK